ncbi:MAG: metallophosphoesterase [Bacteroidetes bacterium]|nr:MAG: metallophosphoesterase [Bacteroidota bacterium]
MKKYFNLFLLGCFVMISSCRKQDLNLRSGLKNGQHLKIAIVSDIHYMDPSLLKNNAAAGAAFQAYIAADPKLIQYSDPIFRECMTQIKAEKPDILLIPGDLTKDGEKVSHQSMSRLLKELAEEHIKIFVVPGNHDVNNPESAQYDGDNATFAPTITPQEFSSFYSAYGYDHAVSRDPNSLSYVSEITPGLWILGIDDCEYEDNAKIAIVAGRIKPQTQEWALHWIGEAKKRNVEIFGMMHHGILEHYTGQNQLDPGYVTDDYQNISSKFMSAGLKVMFTGHYHANDITSKDEGGNTLYDIETGSMVTAPIPYRIVNIQDNTLDITTKYITTISAQLPGGLDIQSYSKVFLSNLLDNYFGYFLASPPYSLPNPLIQTGSPLLRNGIMAHFAGDEHITPDEQAKDDAYGALVPPLGFALNSLWTDLPPADNQLQIKLPD